MTNVYTNVKEIKKVQNFTLGTTASFPIMLHVNASKFEEALSNCGLAMNGVAIQKPYLNLIQHNGTVVTPTILDWEIEIDHVYKNDAGGYTFEATITIPLSLTVIANNFEDALIKSGLAMNGASIQQAVLNFLLHNGSVVTPEVLDWDIDIDSINTEAEGEE